MARGFVLAAFTASLLALTGCGGSGPDKGQSLPTISYVSNDFYDMELTGTTFISAANGVLSNDPGAVRVFDTGTRATSGGGTVTMNSDGSFTYSPPASGSTDSFTFRSEYASGGSTAILEGTVNLRVGLFDPQPTGGTGGTLTVLEETDSVPQTAPGTDPNGLAITYSLSTPPTQAASFTFLADGTYGYRGNVDFSGADSFTYVVINSNGRQSPLGTVNITVTDINDIPTVTVAGNSAANDGTVVNTPLAANLTCSNLTLFTTAPAIATATGDLTYHTAPASSGTANCSLTVQDDGGTANGGVDTSTPTTFDIVVTDVKSPPVVTPAPGPFPFLGNTTLSVAAGSGLLANFSDPADSPQDNVHPTVPFIITAAPAGTLTTSADGSFTYTPVAGARTDDSFTYVVRDDGGANDTSAPITVNLTFTSLVWWVDNTNATAGTGTQVDPFQTIALAEAVGTRQAGDTFRIRQGTGTDTNYDTGFTLLDGDRVIGEGVALVVGAITVDPAGAGAPILSERTSGTNAITLAANNTVSGVNAQATQGGTNYAVFGSAAGSLVTTSLTINSSSGGGIRAAGLSGGTNIQVDALTTTSGEHGIRLEGDTGGTGTATFTGLVAITGSSSDGAILTNTDLTASFPATPTSLVVSNGTGPGGGVTLSGIGTGQEVVISTGGAISIAGSTGLVASNAQVSVLNAGGQFLTTTGGPALSLTNVNVGTANAMTFSGVSATTPTNEGIFLSNAQGTVTILGGTITSPQTNLAAAVRIADSPATVTLTGLTVAASAQAVTGIALTGGTGARVTINTPNINLDVAGSTGIQCAGSHPGFDLVGGTVDTATGAGAGDAINITGTAAGIYRVENATITSATGGGIVATGGTGLIEVRPTTNVTSSGGRALDIDMPSTGVGIQVNNINATGGDFGARILNTSNVQLGPATPGGSTLDGQTDTGILLDTVTTATIRNLVVQNSAGGGIVLNNVSAPTVDGVDVIDNGNTAAEHGLRLFNVDGVAAITASDFLRSGGSNVDVRLDGTGAGPLTLTITNGTYTQTGAPASALDSLHVDSFNGANATVVVTGASFLNQGTGVDAIFARVSGSTGGSGAGTLDLSIGASTFATAASAMDVVKDEDGNLTVTIENNTLSGCNDDCVRVANPLGATNTGGTSTVTITGNTLGNSATAGSASATARGIATLFTGAVDETVTISGNTVQRSEGAGIAVEGLLGSGTTSVDVTNNTAVSDGDDGIRFRTDQTRQMCAAVQSNISTGAGGFQAYLLSQLSTSVMGIEETTSPLGTVASQITTDNTGTPVGIVGAPFLSATDCVP
jgi:hypothetical protein